MNNDKMMWIVTASSTEGHEIDYKKVRATRKEIKKYLFNYLSHERKVIVENNVGSWDFGAEYIDDVEDTFTGGYLAQAIYDSFHIIYSAELIDMIQESKLEEYL